HMVNNDSGSEAQYTIKNLATSGNCPKQDLSADEVAKGLPAGLMMLNCYTNHLTLNNIVADKFFTNIVVDGYGPTGVDIINTKLYDSYSNMSYMWRSKVNVVNSEMIGSGGPLFILCDGDTHFMDPNYPLTDANGSNLTVDKASVLKAYAVGNESWYDINGANLIVNQFKSDLEPGMNALGKTILTTQNKIDYINIIAVIICSPGKLFKGIVPKDENNQDIDTIMDICGSYTTMDGENVHEQFAMHNSMLVQLREASKLPALGGNGSYDATKFPIILQLGNNIAYNKGDGKMYSMQGELTQQEYGAWMMDNTHHTLGVYLSCAAVTKSRVAPYFCAIVEINQKAVAN
ncbi:MAG: hypothetical protein K2N18_01870, partial [Clostridia bacterium]|nr:hypothetical protein [Clostridia bacterium]